MALETGGSLYWKTKIDNTGLTTDATKAKGILRGLARSITGMDIFAGLSIGAAIAFTKITKQVYNFSKNFESAMKEVQTISKAVQDNFKGISKEIMNMSKTVPESAIGLSKALYQIVSAGYDGAKAMKILRISTELGVAAVTDTFTAADALTSIMNAYGKAAGTAANISDKLFTTIKNAKTTMAELGPSITTVTGLAAQAGLTFEDLMAIISTGAKTLKTDIMMTGIRGILTALLKPTDEAREMIEKLSIEFSMAGVKAEGFCKLLQDIIIATGGNAEELAKLFPNVRGLTGFLATATDEGKEFERQLNNIKNSTGATSEAFKIMMETTENQLAILRNNITAKLKPMGDSLLKSMNDIARGINIAMSGANDELSRLARSYSELADTLRSKQDRIDNLIKTVEDLRGKTKLTKEETTKLHAAEEALAIYFPIAGLAAEDYAGKIDILTLAKEGTIDLSIRIMELELEQAKIEQRRAKLAKDIYDREEDEGKKEIERMQDRLDHFYQELTLKQIIERQTTGQVKEYLELEKQLSNATEKRLLEQDQLIYNIEDTTIKVDILTEALENLRKTREKPIAIPETKPRKLPREPIIPILTDEQIEDVKDRLRYMAGQYKKYLSDIAEFGKEYIKEHNAQLFKEGENYSQFLSDMLAKYKDNADLNRQISDDIYEYNNGIITRRKEKEKELFDYIAKEREQELQAEKERFESIIKKYEEGSIEYIEAIKKHEENILEIKIEYAEKEAKIKLDLFKAGWEKQIGEEKEAYINRLEAKLKELEAEKTIDIKRVEFIRNKLSEIAEIEKAITEENKKILASYLSAYKTTEEKIAAINAETAEALKTTSDEVTKNRIKNIEKQRIAAVEFADAKQKIDEKIAEYGEDLNNEQLEEFIKFLEEMKLKYSEYADIIILLNEKIVESQKQIWENTKDEINKTVDSLHALADVVGNFDEELKEAINDIANLISGIGNITIDFSSLGGIAGTLTGILSIVNTIINLFVKHESDVPELKEELQEITLELQKQQNILSQSIGTAKLDAIQDMIDLLNEQINVYNEMIEAEKEAYGQFLWWTWSETDQENINEWLSSIESVNAEIANLQQQYQQILTGTTAETIADAIAEGFAQGLDSAQVFADTFNNMMKQAIMDAFKRAIVTQYIERWYRSFAHLTEGGLTTEEIEFLAARYLEIIEAAETQWETMQSLLESVGMRWEEELEKVDITGLTGAIAGITEETAGLLAGQFQAIRINTVEMLSHMENIIIINARIADNTEYNKYLEHISNKLDEGSSLESEYLRSIGGV